MGKKRTILLVSHYELFRQGVKLALAGRKGCTFIGAEALSATELCCAPDLVIMDGKSLLTTPLSVIRQQITVPGTALLILADQIDATLVQRARRAGARGILTWSASLSAIHAAAEALLRGEDYWPASTCSRSALSIDTRGQALTARQEEVLKYLQQGCLNKQIGFHMKISESTVKSHVSVILRKFDVHSRTMLIASTTRAGA